MHETTENVGFIISVINKHLQITKRQSKLWLISFEKIKCYSTKSWTRSVILSEQLVWVSEMLLSLELQQSWAGSEGFAAQDRTPCSAGRAAVDFSVNPMAHKDKLPRLHFAWWLKLHWLYRSSYKLNKIKHWGLYIRRQYRGETQGIFPVNWNSLLSSPNH